MSDSKNFSVVASGDRDIVITRDFSAPRRLVFEAYTKPELLKRWLLGPPGWEMISCEAATKAGDKYRYVWRHADGKQFGIGGVCREFVPPERLAATENMDGFPTESLVTTVFVEKAGITKLTTTATYVSREVREMALKSGMEHGVAASYDRLDQILASGQAHASSQGAD